MLTSTHKKWIPVVQRKEKKFAHEHVEMYMQSCHVHKGIKFQQAHAKFLKV